MIYTATFTALTENFTCSHDRDLIFLGFHWLDMENVWKTDFVGISLFRLCYVCLIKRLLTVTYTPTSICRFHSQSNQIKANYLEQCVAKWQHVNTFVFVFNYLDRPEHFCVFGASDWIRLYNRQKWKQTILEKTTLKWMWYDDNKWLPA